MSLLERLKSGGAGARIALAGVNAKTRRNTSNPPAEADRILTLTPITKEEFEYFTATKKWAEESAPYMPEANPRKAVDLNELPVPTF